MNRDYSVTYDELLEDVRGLITAGVDDCLSSESIVGNIELALELYHKRSRGDAPQAPLPELDEDDPVVLAVARGIAEHGFARPWDDFLPLNVHDTDQSDLIDYAKAAIASMPAAPPVRSAAMTSKAMVDIAAERERQISVEGWSPQHDDEHEGGQIAAAAGVYALVASDRHNNIAQQFWPWDFQWWKPCDARRNLVKAGALIAAEIDRLDRIDALARNDRGSEA